MTNNKRQLPTNDNRSVKRSKVGARDLAAKCKYVARVLSEPPDAWQLLTSPLELAIELEAAYTVDLVALPIDEQFVRNWDPGPTINWQPPFQNMNQGMYNTMIQQIRPEYEKMKKREDKQKVHVAYSRPKQTLPTWQKVVGTWRIISRVYAVIWFLYPYLTRKEAYDLATKRAKTAINWHDCKRW